MNKDECLAKVTNIVAQANKIFPSLNLDVPYVTWFNKSKSAGVAYIHKNEVGFNIDIMEKVSSEEFHQTIVHEVCHKINMKLYPNSKQGHGPEWKYVMQMMGARPDTYHKFDVSAAKKNQIKLFHYNCSCGKVFKLTANLHNKISRGNNRICLTCHSLITPSQFSGKMSFK